MEDKKEEKVKFEIVGTEPDDFALKLESKLIKCHARAAEVKNRLTKYTFKEIADAKTVIGKLIGKLKKEYPAIFNKPAEKIYVHIDLDAFYASCESLRNPELKNIPFGVGSTVMLATCNYEARKYGIKAGMPGYIAKRYCPQLKIVKTDFVLYNTYSEKVMTVLSEFDKEIEIYGIDEACLVFDSFKLEKAYKLIKDKNVFMKIFDDDEIAAYKNEFDFETVSWVVDKIRTIVYKKVGLTVSAGLSVCRGLAKFASDVNKPNGQFLIKEKFQKFLNDLAVDEINGIGKYTREMLDKSFKIKTIKDLKDNVHLLYLTLPFKSFYNLFLLSFGLIVFDKKHMVQDMNVTKSKAREISFMSTSDYTDLCQYLWDASTEVAAFLQKRKYKGKVLTLKIRYADFESYTKQRKLNKPIDGDIVIFNEVFSIFSGLYCKNHISQAYRYFDLDKPINMIGVRVSELMDVKECNRIFNFRSGVTFKIERYCPICNRAFTYEAQVHVDRHVENCLQEAKKKEKTRKEQIFYCLGIEK